MKKITIKHWAMGLTLLIVGGGVVYAMTRPSTPTVSSSVNLEQTTSKTTETYNDDGRRLETTTLNANEVIQNPVTLERMATLTEAQQKAVTEEYAYIYGINADVNQQYFVRDVYIPTTEEEKKAIVVAEKFVRDLYSWKGEAFDEHYQKLRPYFNEKGLGYFDKRFPTLNKWAYANRQIWFIDSFTVDSHWYERDNAVPIGVYGFGTVKRSNGVEIDSYHLFRYMIHVNKTDYKIEEYYPMFLDNLE